MESLPVDPSLLERANWWFDVSWYGLLWAGAATAAAACATVAFLVLQFWSSGVRETHSEWRTSGLERQTAEAKKDTALAQERIAALNRDTARLAVEAEAARAAIATADARAADANARALEAQLALERFKQPRLLSEAQLNAMPRVFEEFADTPFDLGALPGDPEALIFASHIAAVLEKAGWKWVEWNHPTGPFMTVTSITGKPNIGQLGFFDVSIIVDPSHESTLRKPAERLGGALITEGFKATLDVIENPGIPNKDTVHVIVGKKRQ